MAKPHALVSKLDVNSGNPDERESLSNEADSGAAAPLEIVVDPKPLFDRDTAWAVLKKRLERCGALIAKLFVAKNQREKRDAYATLLETALFAADAAEAFLFVQRFGWLRTLEAQMKDDEDSQKSITRLQIAFDQEAFLRVELKKVLGELREKLDKSFEEKLPPRIDAWVLKVQQLCALESTLLDPLRTKLRPEIGFKLLAACHNNRRPLFALIAAELEPAALAEYVLKMQHCARKCAPSVRMALMPIVLDALSAEQLEAAKSAGLDAGEWNATALQAHQRQQQQQSQSPKLSSPKAVVMATTTASKAQRTTNKVGALFLMKAAHVAFEKAAANCLFIVEREPLVEMAMDSDDAPERGRVLSDDGADIGTALSVALARTQVEGGDERVLNAAQSGWEKAGFHAAFEELTNAVDTYVFVQQSGWHKLMKEKFDEAVKVNALRASIGELKRLVKAVQDAARLLSPETPQSEAQFTDAFRSWRRQMQRVLALESAMLEPLEARLLVSVTIDVLTAVHKDWEALVVFILRELECHGMTRELNAFALNLDGALTQADRAARLRALPLVKKALSKSAYARLLEAGFVGLDDDEATEAAARRRSKSKARLLDSDAASMSVLSLLSPRANRGRSRAGADGLASPSARLSRQTVESGDSRRTDAELTPRSKKGILFARK